MLPSCGQLVLTPSKEPNDDECPTSGDYSSVVIPCASMAKVADLPGDNITVVTTGSRWVSRWLAENYTKTSTPTTPAPVNDTSATTAKQATLGPAAIIGIVATCTVVVFTVIGFILARRRRTEVNQGQTGLWNDDIITANRIPREKVRIVNLISRGAYGEVYTGLFHDHQVAVKMLLPSTRRDIRLVNDFLAEAKLTASMEHPRIAACIGIAWDSLSDLCVVLEFMEGGDLLKDIPDTTMEVTAAPPQLDEAIAYLQAEIAALRAGEKEAILPALAVAVAAGEAPLPEPQFAPLLAVWTPAASSFSTELAALVDQFEAARRREEEAAHRREDKDVKIPVHSALQRVRGQRRRPRTRPRRRFEDPDEGDASQSASDGTPTPSPRADVAVPVVVPEVNKEEEKKEEKKEENVDTDVVMDETEARTEEKDVEMTDGQDEKGIEENAENENAEKKEAKEKNAEEKNTEEKKAEEKNAEVKVEIKEHTTEEKVENNEKVEEKVVEEKNPEKEEAEAALASLKALRKSMLLDVLSKIVSVAKSKDVNPAMFSRSEDENDADKNEEQVDLEKIQDRVAGGVVCEWAQFAEQVYLFCQHVVTDAEQREQPEARRKGVELLHFARTLTETLRKASVKKEAILLQKIRDAEEAAAARKEEAVRIEQEAAARKEEEEKRDKDDDAKDDSKDMERPSADERDNEAAETADNQDSSNKAISGESSGPPPLTPARASTRTRKRTSISSDGPDSAAPSPSSHNPRKRTRGASVSASEDVSGSESHDASASEADTKSRGRTKSSKTPAKRTPARRRRPSLPATRTSSRQQKRRAAAAAAAAAAAVDSGDEEVHSGGEALLLVDDDHEKENDEAEETGEDEQQEEQQTPKKKKAAPKSRSRKKGSRKR
ncbi:hypothetical protein PC116_g10321 [Phytophthora cactorum]|nr:hypothetical protein PC116_g10321 [Phytophthora cactorum]